MSFAIVHQDEHLIVIDKGPGLVVHPGRGHREDTLSQLLGPLLTAGGAGAAGQQAIGTVVFGGMLASTLLAIPFVSVFYVAIHELSEKPGPVGAAEAPQPRA